LEGGRIREGIGAGVAELLQEERKAMATRVARRKDTEVLCLRMVSISLRETW